MNNINDILQNINLILERKNLLEELNNDIEAQMQNTKYLVINPECFINNMSVSISTNEHDINLGEGDGYLYSVWFNGAKDIEVINKYKHDIRVVFYSDYSFDKQKKIWNSVHSYCKDKNINTPSIYATICYDKDNYSHVNANNPTKISQNLTDDDEYNKTIVAYWGTPQTNFKINSLEALKKILRTKNENIRIFDKTNLDIMEVKKKYNVNNIDIKSIRFN